MQWQRFAKWMIACTFLSAWGVAANAQLPDECTGADHTRAAVYTDAAVKALLQQGDTEKFIALLREMESGFSQECRAALDRQQPVRVRCTATERELVLKHYDAIIGAAYQGDVPRMFALFQNLEASVSPTCWLALNQHDDPRVRKICSAAELDAMASYAGPAMRAMQRMLMTGDTSQLLQLAQESTAQLSPECAQAVAQAQQKAAAAQQPAGGAKPPMSLPNVLDHGGGTLSVPGVGACTPSGCMAY